MSTITYTIDCGSSEPFESGRKVQRLRELGPQTEFKLLDTNGTTVLQRIDVRAQSLDGDLLAFVGRAKTDSGDEVAVAFLFDTGLVRMGGAVNYRSNAADPKRTGVWSAKREH